MVEAMQDSLVRMYFLQCRSKHENASTIAATTHLLLVCACQRMLNVMPWLTRDRGDAVGDRSNAPAVSGGP